MVAVVEKRVEFGVVASIIQIWQPDQVKSYFLPLILSLNDFASIFEQAVMSAATPTTHTKGSRKSGGRRNENNKIYANPLPLIFPEPEPTKLNSVLNLLGLSTASVLNPHCEGYFDATTRSVWISNEKDTLTLWRRGFFGKGDLSRSEPSWLARQVNARKDRAAGSENTAALDNSFSFADELSGRNDLRGSDCTTQETEETVQA